MRGESFEFRTEVEAAKQERDQMRLKLQQFIGKGIYPDDEIERDLITVETIKAGWKGESNETGVLAEIALHKNITGGARIFGEKANSVLLSEYDDVTNKYNDAVIEILHGQSAEKNNPYRFVLGADFTSSVESDEIVKKIRGIKKDIDQGTLSNVKYFMSDHGGNTFVGPLKQLPKVVIATDMASALRIATMERDQALNQRALEKDPVIKMLYAELMLQFASYGDYAAKKNRALAEQFSEGIAVLEGVMIEKKIQKDELRNRTILSNPAFRGLVLAIKNSGIPLKL
ncbi:MAG: hypothetical protein A2928_03710 [Candidatus Taylorbacteria bacterium RIFCSPLOWO2_01_FULL_45_15b]|uniref:Uncharacterized protein n=1 Tax=Candidatus Taylorbacteria bacterium RIFCSPLOWO2_01_FULL_45_15b TaxID=1802319 RepID=A0A1G2NGW5_9BACT|nr:MAG: hypothetical protein A2928_03710 [Candidatus Taylorbacteria bacterium RIFCSPLOWO2_01_FULL_45_15b]